jgi:meckelin
MNFTSCGNNKVGSEDCSSCICEPGYAKTEKTRDLPVFECEKCPDGQAPSSDGYKCQKCPGKLNDTNYECECDFSKYEVIIEKYIDGTYRDEKLCVECDKGEKAFTGLYSYSCQSCPDYKMVREDYVCVCKDTIESLDSCFDTSKCGEIPDFTLQYHFVETETGISTHSTSSYIFDYIYPNSTCECNILSSSKACQAFANLCSLTLYDLSQKVCAIYQDSSVPVNLERLFYQGSTKTILETPVTDTKVTLDPDDDSKLNLMEFLLAEFDINGTFLGFQEMTDQLILCPHSLEDSKKYRKFGTNMIIECSFDLSTIYDKPQTTFFELYFKEQSGNYIDVPILVTNMRNADSQIINKESSSQSNWKLTRRFFIWDNISGYDNKVKYEQKNIDIIQYLQKVKLRFTLRSDKEQQIYVPYLILTYRARRKDYLTEKDNTATVSFVTEYSMDTSKFWEIAQGIFIGANVIVLMSWITRLYVWTKINPHKDSPTTWTTWMILTSIRMLISTWGFVMFWYIFGLTGYWFIFYKLQYHVYALVPPLSTFQENYYPFEVVLCLTISCCLFNAFYQVYRQADLDMLVIDWEKPNREPTSQIDQEKAYKEYVSAWRYLFIVNELNELQCKRYISLEFSLFFFVFLLDGLGWDELSLAQPSSDVGNVENNTSPRNPVLRYFLTCSLLLVIMYSQFIIKKILSNQFATPVQNFIDLCSVANVSVMVLDEFLHGYYIHGVSPNGSAETGLDELLENLNKEASGKSRARGILPEDTTGLQSYEIFIPTAIRKTYNNLGKQPLENDMILYRQEHREASKLPTVPEALPNNLKIENAQEVRLELNRRMKIYIAGLVRDAKTQLLDKSPWQRFLRMPPVDLSTLDGTPYFYRDPGIGFEGCFLMGREFSFLMMDIALFELFDYTIGMTYVAILLTYVVSNIVIKVRAWAGEWNLARKTLVNKRFLL